jgi:hypothetical protein
MVRAVLRNGKIQLVDAVPPDWKDGDIVTVRAVSESAKDSNDKLNESFDEWVADLREATQGISKEDHQQFMTALELVEKESKELARRELEEQSQVFDHDASLSRVKEAG